MGIEPTLSAWKAEVLPLNYTRAHHQLALSARQHRILSPSLPRTGRYRLVEGGGFEPPKAEPSDLQSDPFDRSGTPPTISGALCGLGISLSSGASVRQPPERTIRLTMMRNSALSAP